jgi:SAM-dependent methyltransferase
MKDYGPETYGDRVADVYDELYASGTAAHAGFLDTEGAVAKLTELAGDGPALELAIGTGRLALPLAERGIEVHGIDASEAMVAKLRAKPGGERIPVTIGDFADVAVDSRYRAIFVAFNTFFALLTQEDQIRCFENAAAHLTDDGVFAIEVFVPDLARFDRNQRVNANIVDIDRVMIDVAQHNPIKQTVASQHVMVTEQGITLYPVNIRYAFPSELDLMARLAGLHLLHRWGGWREEPFDRESQRHVSVWAR